MILPKGSASGRQALVSAMARYPRRSFAVSSGAKPDPRWRGHVNEHGEFTHWMHVFSRSYIITPWEYQFAVPWVFPDGYGIQEACALAKLGALKDYPGRWPSFCEMTQEFVYPHGIVIPALNAIWAKEELMLRQKAGALKDLQLFATEEDGS